jgi:hypothetical protein
MMCSFEPSMLILSESRVLYTLVPVALTTSLKIGGVDNSLYPYRMFAKTLALVYNQRKTSMVNLS